MKNYLIIIHDYTGIGGAQLYAIRRANYLIENGYSVSFLVSHFNDSKIGKPESVKIYFNKYLNIPTICLSKNIVNQELDKFIADFKVLDNLIIETFSTEASTWGEIFAQNLGFKHIIYSLGEPNLHQFRYGYFLDFFLFKYYRGELLGLSDCSLRIILGKYFQSNKNYFVNISFDASEVTSETLPKFLGKVNLDSFVIGTLSRLEKEYVSVFVDQVIELAHKYPDKQFSLLVCGEGVKPGLKASDFIEKYSNNVQKPSNLVFFFPGYTFPVGKDFFETLDVFVGMGTAAVSSISQKCATICVDPRVNKSIGIFGVQTRNFAYSNDNKYFEMNNSIEELFLNNEKLLNAQSEGYKLFTEEFENRSCMNKIDLFIQNSARSNDYFFTKSRTLIDYFNILMIRLTYLMISSKFLVNIYNKSKLLSNNK
jgi:hypothetical protein